MMDRILIGIRYSNRFWLLLVLFITISVFSEARKSAHFNGADETIIQQIKKLKVTKHFDFASLLLQQETMTPSNGDPYVSSLFTLPSYDSLAPNPFPPNAPPFCIYPPNTPQSPSTLIPTPTGSSTPPAPFYLPPVLPISSPPPPSSGGLPSPPVTNLYPNPPQMVPSPSRPTVYFLSPPSGYVPILSPPFYEPSPPILVPGYVPSPTVFLPPIVYPPPLAPPSPSTTPAQALWCVAKPSVPDPIIQEAMNYACGSGADCDSLQSSGSCFEPNTLFAHASYAFNSYWQRTKVAGGTCSFGGTAMLITVDPSHDGCRFVYF